MMAIWRALKTLSPLQIVAVAVVLFGAAAATYGGYLRANSADPVALEENQQLIPVRMGDLVNQVTTSGTIAFPNRQTLRFGSPGIVAELSVEEGEAVSNSYRTVAEAVRQFPPGDLALVLLDVRFDSGVVRNGLANGPCGHLLIAAEHTAHPPRHTRTRRRGDRAGRRLTRPRRQDDNLS